VALALFEELANAQRNGLPFPTHAHTHKTETKKKNLETPKTVLRKLKEGKKEIQQENTDINNIFKNYRK